jgi:hypothetical protein
MRHSIRFVAAAAVFATVIVAVAAGAMAAANPTRDQLPPEKQAQVDAAASLRVSAPRADKSNDPGRPIAAPADTSPETGLVGAVNAPISGSLFTPQNEWAGWTSATTFTQVWAGAAPGDTGHGLVFVVRRSGDGRLLDDESAPITSLVEAPAIGGPLKIVRVENGNLVIANPGGHEFIFNPATGAFG